MKEAILDLLGRMQDEEGQALAEFTLIVAFIAAVCIVAATALGTAAVVPFQNFMGGLQGS